MHWIAEYTDGTKEDGRNTPYAEMRRSQLSYIFICDDSATLFESPVYEGDTFRWRRRVWMSSAGRREIGIVVIGTDIYIVFASGAVEHHEKFEVGHPYADPIVDMDCER